MNQPKKILIGISGLGETDSRPSGIEDILFRAVMDIPDTVAARFTWRDSTREIRRLALRYAARWPGIQISLLGYSYGGTTAVNAMHEIDSIPVTNLFLIDPVWRPFQGFPSMLSLFGMGTLWVPGNVDSENCYIWRQDTRWIRGCTVLDDSGQSFANDMTIPERHTRIDNSPQIIRTIMQRMKR